MFTPQLVFATPMSQKHLERGNAYTVSHIFESVSNGDDAELLISCGDHAVYLGYKTFVGGQCYGRIYESPTITSNGTDLSIISNNRANILSDGCSFYHTPSVSSDGTLLAEALIPGGSGIFSRSGAASGLSQWIIAPNTSYYIKITNDSGGAIDISHTFNFSCAGLI